MLGNLFVLATSNFSRCLGGNVWFFSTVEINVFHVSMDVI